MQKNLLEEKEITLEKLREQFQNNDFTQTALKRIPNTLQKK